MMIDCDSCTVRGAACADCVVTFMTIGVRRAAHVNAARVNPAHAGSVDLDDAERAAIAVLASSGLVPPLRLQHRA